MITWRELVQSYPCLECGAGPGEPCVTKGGNSKYECHAIRSHVMDHCPKCGARMAADAQPGEVCDRCALVRRLEIERATYHQRRT